MLPAAAMAENEIEEPAGNAAVHAPGQSTPAGLDCTRPEPGPSMATAK
jgi:hypothetical protein